MEVLKLSLILAAGFFLESLATPLMTHMRQEAVDAVDTLCAHSGVSYDHIQTCIIETCSCKGKFRNFPDYWIIAKAQVRVGEWQVKWESRRSKQGLHLEFVHSVTKLDQIGLACSDRYHNT